VSASAQPARAGPKRATLGAWVRLLRLHFVPLSLSAGVVGIVADERGATAVTIALGVAVCTSGYAIGQVINDYADRGADVVNAPDRPFVTGEIDARFALLLAAAGLAAITVAAALLAPPVAVWIVIALLGHLLYGATKGVPLVGNVVNGADLATFTLIGAAAAAPDRGWDVLSSTVVLHWGLMALAFTAFSVNAYFKDVAGDAAAGYRTLPVVLGTRRASWFTIPFPLAAVGWAAVLAAADPGALGVSSVPAAFWALLALAAIAFAAGVAVVLVRPDGSGYETLVWTTRAVVLFALALTAVHRPGLALALALPLLVLLEGAMRPTRAARQA
jgi:4-hydroxybenzoate polyprenyltransferase